MNRTMSGRRRVVRAFDGELVDRPELVFARPRPVHQTHEVSHRFAIALVLHRHTVDQQLVKCPVGRQQRREPQVLHLVQRILAGGGGQVRVQPPDGLAQAKRQQHLAVVSPLGVGAVVRNVVAADGCVTQLGQPAHGFLFELVFGHHGHDCAPDRMRFSAIFT